MPGIKKKTKEKPDRPTPFVVYILSVFLAFIVLMPASVGFFYLLDISFFTAKSNEKIVLSALILGAGLTIVSGAVLGYFANRQITDIKE